MKMDEHPMFRFAMAICELTIYALDQLEATAETGCCYECCLPCHGLHDLQEMGDLDRLLGGTPGARDPFEGARWWLAEENRVDSAFLEHAWRITGRHEGCPFELDGT